MTIRKGEEWGSVGPAAPGAPVARSDREAGRIATALLAPEAAPDAEPPMIVVLGGDLHRSLGAPTDVLQRMEAGQCRLLPIDVVRVEWDGGREVAVAHVIARRRRWQGSFVVAMNATHVGRLDLGPRAHPNDGLADLTVGRLDARDRLAALRRARHGGHLPHPGLQTTRTASWHGELDRSTPLYVDGERVGRTRRLRFEVLPDALVVAV